MTARFILAARRLALYADECALILREHGYVGKGQSLEAKVKEVMDACPEPPKPQPVVKVAEEGRQ
jgi:hypothetical protein